MNELYALFAQLRAQGDSSYHALFSAHATMHSIIIASLSFLTAAIISNDKFCGNGSAVILKLFPILPLLISTVGIIASFKMRTALNRFTSKNYYLEWNCRKLELLGYSNNVTLFQDIRNFQRRFVCCKQGNGAVGTKELERFIPDTSLTSKLFEKIPPLKYMPYLFIAIYATFFIFNALFLSNIA